MIETILQFWPLILGALQVLTMWVGWSLKQEFVSKDDLANAVDTAMKQASQNTVEIVGDVQELQVSHKNLHRQVTDDIDKRLLRIEESIKHMPTHGDLTRLHKRMDDINAQLQQIAGSMTGYGHTLRLIEQHLLAVGNRE